MLVRTRCKIARRHNSRVSALLELEIERARGLGGRVNACSNSIQKIARRHNSRVSALLELKIERARGLGGRVNACSNSMLFA